MGELAEKQVAVISDANSLAYPFCVVNRVRLYIERIYGFAAEFRVIVVTAESKRGRRRFKLGKIYRRAVLARKRVNAFAFLNETFQLSFERLRALYFNGVFVHRKSSVYDGSVHFGRYRHSGVAIPRARIPFLFGQLRQSVRKRFAFIIVYRLNTAFTAEIYRVNFFPNGVILCIAVHFNRIT